MNPFLAFLLISLASARLTRLAFKDSLFDEPRNALIDALGDPTKLKRGKGPVAERLRQRHKVPFWIRAKIGYMITCPYCVSAYCTAVVLLGYRIWVEPIPAPVLWWFAAWMLAIIVLEYTDGD